MLPWRRQHRCCPVAAARVAFSVAGDAHTSLRERYGSFRLKYPSTTNLIASNMIKSADQKPAGKLRRLFDRAVSDKALDYHFPFPAVGTIVQDGTGYTFVPAA
jgi:hypothetical protein